MFMLMIVALLLLQLVPSESIEGAWKATVKTKSGSEITQVLLIKDGYLTQTEYDLASKRFLRTFGGRLTRSDNQLSFRVDFTSSGTPLFADSITLSYNIENGMLTFNEENLVWQRIDKAQSEMAASWFITGRARNGEMQINQVGARRTLKLLTDTRFQWVAFNHDTGVFSGSGGGTYSAKDGTYIETIEFFSRDSSRVGAVLPFEFELKNEEWHHKGLSSKGEPIYEIWSKWVKINH